MGCRPAETQHRTLRALCLEKAVVLPRAPVGRDAELALIPQVGLQALPGDLQLRKACPRDATWDRMQSMALVVEERHQD